MRNRAALSRAGVAPDRSPSEGAGDSRIRVSLQGLRSLEAAARAISFLPKQPARSALQGRHRSRIRGRGLDFEELRDYLPGDDVRAIDWKVTARAGSPYVRVYTEERDRPTLIVVDQRMSMFYGTVHNTKAVTAAECAAIVAHRVAKQGDRVGGVVFGDADIDELRPGRGRAAVTRFLTSLEVANHRLTADAPKVTPMPFNEVLASVARLATRDHLVILISDFDACDDETERRLGAIALHNDVVLGLVGDPSADMVPETGEVTASDGQKQTLLDFQAEDVRAGLAKVTGSRRGQVAEWQKRMRLSVLPLTTAEDTLGQVVRLLGGRAR